MPLYAHKNNNNTIRGYATKKKRDQTPKTVQNENKRRGVAFLYRHELGKTHFIFTFSHLGLCSVPALQGREGLWSHDNGHA